MFQALVGLGKAVHQGAPEHQQWDAQKLLEPAQEQAEVVASGGEHGVVAVTVAALEVVAAHPVILLDVPDDELDGCTTAHLAADGLGYAPDLAGDPDLEAVRMVVTAIAFVSVDTASRNACELFEIGDDGAKRMAVVRVAVQRLGVQHELAALGGSDRRRDRDLAAELVGFAGLPPPMHSTSGACNE